MARVSLVELEHMQDWQRAQYDRFPSNLTRALLLLDQRLAGQLPATANALRAADLDPAWREAIILRVASLQNSAYERFHHLGQAQRLGWTSEQITAIERGAGGEVLPEELRVVLDLVDKLTAAPVVPDSVTAAARTVLSDRQLATVVVLVGHYMTVARIVATLDVDVDDAPDSWVNEH